MAKKSLKYSISFKLIGPLFVTNVSDLVFLQQERLRENESIDHVLPLSVSKHGYSFELGHLRGSILSKVDIL